MLLSRFTYAICIVLAFISLSACDDTQSSSFSNKKVEATRSLMDTELEQAVNATTTFIEMLAQEGSAENKDQLVETFKEIRTHFKPIEFIIGQHFPGTAKKLNGPALPWIEDYDPNATIIDPEGFQVIEELLYVEEPLDIEALNVEAGILRANLRKIRQYNEVTVYTDRHILESIRFGLTRMLSLGLSGFDSPVANESLRETVLVLDGFEAALTPYFSSVSEELGNKIKSTNKGKSRVLN